MMLSQLPIIKLSVLRVEQRVIIPYPFASWNAWADTNAVGGVPEVSSSVLSSVKAFERRDIVCCIFEIVCGASGGKPRRIVKG